MIFSIMISSVASSGV